MTSTINRTASLGLKRIAVRRTAFEGNLGGFCVGPNWASLLSRIYGRAHAVNSTLKVQKSEPTTLIESIKAEIKKRSEAKAKRMLLKRPKRLTKRYG